MDEAFLNDLLECSVCLEQLDSTSKVLPCQHTFCKRCLEEIVHSHKELRCPECRVLVEIAVDDLPSNILLIRLLEGIKNNPRSSTRIVNTPSKKVETSISARCLVPSRTSQVSELPSRVSMVSDLPSRAPLASELPSRAALVSDLPSRVSLVSEQLRRRTQPEVCEQRTPSKQILQSAPCAKAIYSYEGKEPGDLSFKKGDLIILQKRIDQNWYHGEANGKHGFLPARYVQVVVPLPTHVPQCKALYDFSVANNDEKDCLTFKKGEVITVIRRVDDNWAEGKLADKIGIFPISFVEMNVSARSLMKLSVNTQPGPSRVAPPTPTVEASQDSTVPVTKSATVTSNANLPVLDPLSSAATTPSPTSSSATSPSTLSSSSSSASLTTKVPVTELSTTPVLMRSSSQRSSQEREKRHSLSSLSSSPSCPKSSHIPVTHRHSAEILSTSGGDVLVAPKVPQQTNLPTATKSTGTNGVLAASNLVVEETGPRIIRRHSHRETDDNKPHVVAKSAAVVPLSGSGSTSNTSPITVQSLSPTYYMALYNYRPQKEDELELKKGEMYMVSEKCQDGWFKGTSVLNGRSGVFPGNYVHFAKIQGPQNPFHQSHSSAANSRSNKSQLPISNTSRCKTSVVPAQHGTNPFVSAISNSDKVTASALLLARPRPSPRETRTSVAAGLLEWARSVTAVNNPPIRPHRGDASQEGEQLLSSQAPILEGVPSVPSSTDTSPWVSRLTTCSQFPTPPANSTIIQPTSMAASYPSPSVVSQTQPDPASFPTKISQSWHGTRTFSHSQAPSLSVASPPNVSLRAPVPLGIRQPHSKPDKHKARKDKNRESLMKRLTSKRKSRSPPVDLSCDNPSFVDSPSTHAAVSPIPVAHARSDSCPADILSVPNSEQKTSVQVNSSVTESQKPSSRLKQPSAVRERFRCVVPYPPNSEYELELKVGDIVYVHKKRDDGWFKGTLQRTGKTGLFPASFVDSY